MLRQSAECVTTACGCWKEYVLISRARYHEHAPPTPEKIELIERKNERKRSEKEKRGLHFASLPVSPRTVFHYSLTSEQIPLQAVSSPEFPMTSVFRPRTATLTMSMAGEDLGYGNVLEASGHTPAQALDRSTELATQLEVITRMQ